MKKDIIEITWLGRGGQGAITAAKIVANAAFLSGYGGVVMAPTFGTERRGAPVFTSLKMSEKKIYDLSPIERPDIAVVLDHLLLEEVDIVRTVKPGGTLILNTPLSVDQYQFPEVKTSVADVTAISVEAGLRPGIVNSGIIGAFARTTRLVDMELLVKKIKEEFHQVKPEKNAAAAIMTFEKTVIGG